MTNSCTLLRITLRSEAMIVPASLALSLRLRLVEVFVLGGNQVGALGAFWMGPLTSWAISLTSNERRSFLGILTSVLVWVSGRTLRPGVDGVSTPLVLASEA